MSLKLLPLLAIFSVVPHSFQGMITNNVDVRRVATNDTYAVQSGEWTETEENGERILTNSGGGSINVGEATTDNAFEVQIRHNTFMVDRNINLNVVINGTTFTLDMRHDDGAKALRFRINGGFNAYDFGVNYLETDWIKFKMAFYENEVLCYVDDVLAYDYSCEVDPTASKVMNLSSWDIPASFKNPRSYHEEKLVSTLPESLFDSMNGTTIIGDKYYYKLTASGCHHNYLGSTDFNQIEYDLYVKDWTGDRNIGLYFTNEGIEYGLRFDGNGTYVKRGEEVCVTANPINAKQVHHVKHIVDSKRLATYVDDVEYCTYDTSLSSTFTGIRYWDWNCEAYIGYFEISHAHVYTHHAANPATCSTNGNYEYYTCSCGKVFDSEKVETTLEAITIPSAGGSHNIDTTTWNSNAEGHFHPCTICGGAEEVIAHTGTWTQTLAPTKDDFGTEERTCDVCGYYEQRNIDKLPEDYIFSTSQWVRVDEGGEEVYNSIQAGIGGGGEILVADNSVGNAFKVKVRANEAANDRNVQIHIVTTAHDYAFDYRQDVDCFRLRIDGEYTRYDQEKHFDLGEWFEMKIIVGTNNIKCYVNDELLYNHDDERVALDETNKFTISAWDCNVSIKNPVVFTQTDEVVGLRLESQPTKTTYLYGDDLDLTGVSVKKIMMLSGEVDCDLNELTVSGYDSHVLGTQTVRLSIGEKYVEFNVLVEDKPVSLQITNEISKKSYKYGEELDLTGLVITANFASGATNEVSAIDYEISGYNKHQLGQQTVTVSYRDLTIEFNVEVVDYETEIKVATNPIKTEYEVGESLDITGLTIEVTMASGAKETVQVTEDMVSGFNSEEAKVVTITITYKGLTTQLSLTIKEVNNPNIDSSEQTSSQETSSSIDESSSISSSINSGGGTQRKSFFGSVPSIILLCSVVALAGTGIVFLILKKRK